MARRTKLNIKSKVYRNAGFFLRSHVKESVSRGDFSLFESYTQVRNLENLHQLVFRAHESDLF